MYFATLMLPLLAMAAKATPVHRSNSEIDVTKFVARINELFPQNTTLYTNTTGMIETWELLAKEFSIDPQEDALNSTRCTDITVVFAKGTYELGNIGILVGPMFLDALQEQAGRKTVSMQGVEYAANMTGYQLGGDPDGSLKMAFEVAAVAVKCPKTKITISGFSQGALLAHNAANYLPSVILQKVSSGVTFGDPLSPAPLNGMDNKTLILCNPGDDVCLGGTGQSIAHLSYSKRVDEAATYVLSKANGY